MYIRWHTGVLFKLLQIEQDLVLAIVVMRYTLMILFKKSFLFQIDLE